MKIISRNFLHTMTPTCHASTMTYHDGNPVYAWFGGSREGNPDSAIFIQFGDSKEQYVIGRDTIIARWNPILFSYGDRLYIFIKAGDFCDRWQTQLYDITDIKDNKTPMAFIPAGLNGPVKTKVIVDDKTGLIYCGSAVETRFDWTSYVEVFEMVDGVLEYKHRTAPIIAPKVIYKDGMFGKQRMSNGIIQPSLWMDEERVMHSFFRSSTGLDKLYYSSAKMPDSKDDFRGFVWETSRPIDGLENPNSGMDTVYVNGRLFLIYNPDPVLRNPLTLVELDKDLNIIDEIVITETTDGTTYTGELSYPYMIEQDGSLEIVYTYGRSKIELVKMTI